ncbi:NADPH:quinone reductase [Chytriomyces sp. MP71]|nr:NADPH:quinone reductase [Chytriomyces sp. MP71]
MRQVVFPKANAIELRESAEPSPGAGEVRVRVKAFGVNFADVMMKGGFYGDAPPFPNVAGYEVSGIVDAVGSGVGAELIGTRVAALTKFNGYADTAIVSAQFAVRVPETVSFVEAASVPVVYLTAWMLLVHFGSIKKGEVVLIQNAGGGVGLAAIDIIRQIGATSIGTASASKHAFLASRGLDHAIDYRNQDFEPEVMRITNGKGADLIIDPIGGRASWTKNFRCLRKGGRLGIFGASSMAETLKGQTNPFALAWAWIQVAFSMVLGAPKWTGVGLMEENKGVFGVNMAKMFDDPEYPKEWLLIVMKGIEDGWVRPHVDCVYEMTHVAEAHKRLEDRKSTGKIVIVPDLQDPVHDLSKFNVLS